MEFRVPKGHAISYSVAFAIRLLVLVHQYMIVGNANPVTAGRRANTDAVVVLQNRNSTIFSGNEKRTVQT